MAETYYDRLGVAPDATNAEIRQAYRERLKEDHPDVSEHADAADRTRRLVEAKEVLTDDRERARYDRLGHAAYVGQTTDATPDSAGRDSSSDGVSSTASAQATADTSGGTERTSRTDRTRTDRTRTDREQRRRQNRETRANWNTAGQGQRSTDSTQGRQWRAWDTDAPYRVHAADSSTVGSRLFPPGPSLVLLTVGFALYPLVLWASLTPAFPLAINLIVALCLVALVAFFVGMPPVGLVVFGTWSLLLPAVLTLGFGVPPLSPPWLVAVGGTTLPFGLSALIYAALRG